LAGGGEIESGVFVSVVISISAAMQQAIEAGGLFTAHVVDGQVASHGEEPGAESVFVVELVAAFEHTNPGFLEEVFGEFAVSGQRNKVAEKAMLILLDEAVEQVGISTSQSAGDLRALLRHRTLEIESGRVHTNFYTGLGGEKTQGARRGGRGAL